MNSKPWRHIKNFLSLPPVYSFLFLKVLKQKKFIKTHLQKELYPFRLNNDGSLSAKDFWKIKHYYSLGVPGVLGESFCVLRGKPMQARERLCLSFLGGISGLLDDLFDDPAKNADHLEGFILTPEDMQPANSHEKLLLHFYELGLHYAAQPRLLKEQAKKVFKAQKQSIKQQESGTNVQEIEAVIASKGGASFIFYRLCLDHPLTKAEEELLYHLGALMQLGNDIFDVWEDHRDNIKTAATLCADVGELRESFSRKFEECYILAKHTPYSQRNIRRFFKFSALALARVYVCLDQFTALQKSTGNHFSIEKYSRKQLICDMQNSKNQFKAMKYYLKMIY